MLILGTYRSMRPLIPNNLVKIWRADNNGQLSRAETNANNIEKWALGNKLENVNSYNLIKCYEDNDWIARNAFAAQNIRIQKSCNMLQKWWYAVETS